MIKNIIFDLGSVLLKGTYRDTLNKFDISEEDKKIIISTFFDNWEELDLGNMSLKEKLDNSNIPNYIKNEYGDILLNYYKYRDINMDLISLIKKLKEKGYKICILSDNIKEVYNYCKSSLVFSDVDIWVVSCEYNCIKEDKKLFNILFDKYHINPKESYFIDDKEININIGLSFGMKGFVFNDDANELVKDMEKELIVF